MKYELRPYQIEAVEKTREALRRGKKRILVVAPTGAGKTVIGTHMIESAVARGSNTLFLAHRKELIDQCSKKLDEIGLCEHGIIKASHWRTDYSRQTQVGSIQTFIRRLDKIPWDKWKFRMVMADEAHHSVSPTWMKVMEMAKASDIPVIGLTATPYRGDGKGLSIYEELVEVTTTAQLVDEGFLCPSRVLSAVGPDLKAVKTVAGDYRLDDLGDVMDKTVLVGNIVETWLKNGRGRTTVCFAVNVAHSKHIVDLFVKAGVRAEHLDGEMSDDVREGILSRLASGETELVANCGVLTEGFDLPRIAAIILARPTKSRGMWRQMAGRGLRHEAGKTDCLILDHAGCTFEHGFLTDPDDLSLSDGCKRPRRGEGSKRFACPICRAQFGGWPRFCPACGIELPRTKPDPIKSDESVDLQEVTPATIRRKFFHDMSARAFKRGYMPGYAFAKFREKFGAWPSTNELHGCQHKSKRISTPDGMRRVWIRENEMSIEGINA